MRPSWMDTTFCGQYVPLPEVSFQSYGYEYHLLETAEGKLPSGTSVEKSSRKS